MKISIITPSYNQGQYIEETILSVINQNYPNLEYIIIDGGSCDNSIEIIKKYASKLSYWVSEIDNGQSDAINKGLKIATGDLIMWLNSDDLLEQNCLTKVANLFERSSAEIGVIYGGTTLFNSKKLSKINWGYPQPTIERYISGMAFPQPSAFIKKKYWEIVGPLDISLHYGMDYDLFSKLALVTKFKGVDELFSKYRLHEASKSKLFLDLFIEDWIKSYANVLYNLNIIDKYKIIIDLDILSKEYKPLEYTFEFKNPDVDWELSFYYFLTYVLRSDYQNNKFERAKRINSYLKNTYNYLLKKDKDIQKISTRLNVFPGIIIKNIRTIKN